MTGIEFVDSGLLDVKTYGPVLLAEFNRQRQPNVAEADDADADGGGVEFQRGGCAGTHDTTVSPEPIPGPMRALVPWGESGSPHRDQVA